MSVRVEVDRTGDGYTARFRGSPKWCAGKTPAEAVDNLVIEHGTDVFILTVLPDAQACKESQNLVSGIDTQHS